MSRQRKRQLPVDRANVVGIIQSAKSLKLARTRAFSRLDVFEIRLDAFSQSPDPAILKTLPAPLIATVRDASEGGLGEFSPEERAGIYRAALPCVAAIDVELACRGEQRETLAAARCAGVKVILSMHDFAGCPAARELRHAQKTAVCAGADVFKIAVTPRSVGEFVALLALLDDPPIPTSVMGMGALGPASRIAAMSCGSVLNYGWIEAPNVPGQLSALELREFVS